MTALTILHTNDIHGRVDQLARIATLARRIRDQAAARGGDCLLCDAGDVEDPTLPSCASMSLDPGATPETNIDG